MFDEKSRYAHLPLASLATPGGRTVVFVTRRMVPPGETYVAAGSVAITDSERLDHLAFRHLGLPTAFYQLADANEAMHPLALVAASGARLIIPLPLLSGGRR
jgi:hypothetical protein